MANGMVVTDNGMKIVLNRTFKSTPDYSEPSLFSVGTGTGTPSTSDTGLGTAVSIDGDNFKGFVSGYPVLDETNLQATIRCLLLSTEANSNSLTEFGILNTDGTKKLFSRSVFTAITKTASVQVVFVEKENFQ